MISAIKNLFSSMFHSHKWEMVDSHQVCRRQAWSHREVVIAVIYVQRCAHCGKMRNHKVSVSA